MFNNKYHELKEGEDMDDIVRKYGIIIEDFLEVNDWRAFEDLKVGEMIKIPPSRRTY